jgi:enoyl-CoA hydratase
MADPDTAVVGRVHLDVDDGVAKITLDSPRRRNAMSIAMAHEVVRYCDQIDRDLSVGAVVVSGAGAHFCSGAERGSLAAASLDPADSALYRDLGMTYQAFMRVGTLAVPTVAAVCGAAVGAGVNLMMATDLRIVARDARILSGFGPIGLHPGGGHFTLLARAGGFETSAALGLFGEEVNGDEAVACGLAWRATAADEVLDYAVRIAGRVAVDPELARATVASFRTQLGPPAQSWPIALAAERAPQMWSLRRRGAKEEEERNGS